MFSAKDLGQLDQFGPIFAQERMNYVDELFQKKTTSILNLFDFYISQNVEIVEKISEPYDLEPSKRRKKQVDAQFADAHTRKITLQAASKRIALDPFEISVDNHSSRAFAISEARNGMSAASREMTSIFLEMMNGPVWIQGSDTSIYGNKGVNLTGPEEIKVQVEGSDGLTMDVIDQVIVDMEESPAGAQFDSERGGDVYLICPPRIAEQLRQSIMGYVMPNSAYVTDYNNDLYRGIKLHKEPEVPGRDLYVRDGDYIFCPIVTRKCVKLIGNQKAPASESDLGVGGGLTRLSAGVANPGNAEGAVSSIAALALFQQALYPSIETQNYYLDTALNVGALRKHPEGMAYCVVNTKPPSARVVMPALKRRVAEAFAEKTKPQAPSTKAEKGGK